MTLRAQRGAGAEAGDGAAGLTRVDQPKIMNTLEGGVVEEEAARPGAAEAVVDNGMAEAAGEGGPRIRVKLLRRMDRGKEMPQH